MKSEIRARNSSNLTWYSWVETCDRCGDLIHRHELETTNRPNREESDYCSSCLRYALANGIKYD